MKKLIALIAVVAILAISLVPVAAEEAATQNVMLTAVDFVTYNIKNSPSWFNMIDEYRWYSSSDSLSYADFALVFSKANIADGTYLESLVNLAGETGKEDSKYMAVFVMELDNTYTVDSMSISLQSETSANLDGFDLLLSTDGTNWTTAVSVTEVYCEDKGAVQVIDEHNTFVYSAKFAKTDAKYVAFGLTQPRCQHADTLAKKDPPLTPNANTHYFRISELELFTYDPNAPVETTAAPVETTAAPVETTAAPIETTAPTEAPATADASMIVVAAAALALASATVIRRRARG